MDIDISILCSVIKKYLCELTNPLIPTEWYTEFIDSASKYITTLYSIYTLYVLYILYVFYII